MLKLFKPRLLGKPIPFFNRIPRRFVTTGLPGKKVNAVNVPLSRSLPLRNKWSGLLVSAFGAASMATLYKSNKGDNLIQNDAAVQDVPFPVPIEIIEKDSKAEKQLRRKSYYRQLCLGSICGIVTGLLLVKVSVAVIYVVIFGFLGLEWLKSRNIITINHNELLRIGKSQLARVLYIGRDTVTDLNLFNLSFLTVSAMTYYYV